MVAGRDSREEEGRCLVEGESQEDYQGGESLNVAHCFLQCGEVGIMRRSWDEDTKPAKEELGFRLLTSGQLTIQGP